MTRQTYAKILEITENEVIWYETATAKTNMIMLEELEDLCADLISHKIRQK